jgi:uncharacterized protein YggU (UPF0235/DUF167 family)
VKSREAIAVLGSKLSFYVRLTPKGGRDAIEGWGKGADGGAHLKVRVSAVPENGKANAALVSLIAKALGIAKSAVSVAGGHTARLKHLEIDGDPNALQARLRSLGETK